MRNPSSIFVSRAFFLWKRTVQKIYGFDWALDRFQILLLIPIHGKILSENIFTWKISERLLPEVSLVPSFKSFSQEGSSLLNRFRKFLFLSFGPLLGKYRIQIFYLKKISWSFHEGKFLICQGMQILSIGRNFSLKRFLHIYILHLWLDESFFKPFFRIKGSDHFFLSITFSKIHWFISTLNFIKILPKDLEKPRSVLLIFKGFSTLNFWFVFNSKNEKQFWCSYREKKIFPLSKSNSRPKWFPHHNESSGSTYMKELEVLHVQKEISRKKRNNFWKAVLYYHPLKEKFSFQFFPNSCFC